MMTWLLRGVCGLFVVLSLLAAVNAIGFRAWQYGVLAVAFVVAAAGAWRIGQHWKSLNGGGEVVLDATTGFTAAVIVAVLVVGVLPLALRR